ncbi:hypothetical protein EUW85_20080 [Salmonella enterica subsp. enterica serovar Ngili]|nr:hypothetical protein [Salmonella enterica subsp. enterica serovar Ngili]
MEDISPKIAFIYPCMPHNVYAPCLNFSSTNNMVNLVVCTGFIRLPDDGYQYLCTLNIFNPSGTDLLQDEDSDFPALFPINPDIVNKNSGITFVKSEASILIEETGYYHIVCTLYSQGFGEILHVNESWFYIDAMVGIK